MEYFIRYNDVNKKKIVPLQIKINNFSFGNWHMFPNNTALKMIYSDDKEFFKKCREIWNKIIELIGINNPIDFVDADDDANLLWQMYTKIQALLLKIIIHMGIIKTQ